MRSDFRLGPAEKADARSALVLLAGSGLSLTEAARRALMAKEKREAPLPRMDIADAIKEFLGVLHRRGRRGATLEYNETQLGIFSEAPFAARWQRVERPELKKWLEALPGAYSTRHMVFRCVRALYRWAHQRDPRLVDHVPTEGIKMDGAPAGRATIRFYPVEQCAELLARVSAKARPALALHLFAGIRPMEIAPRFPGKGRLAWEHIDFADRAVRVPSEVSKTHRARPLERLPTPLFEWLALTPAAERKGPIWPDGDQHWRAHLRRAHAGTEWIEDGFRHTFATMVLAATRSAGDVVEWMGHEGGERTFRNHYAGLARRAEGEAFCKLLPPEVVAARIRLLRLLAERPDPDTKKPRR